MNSKYEIKFDSSVLYSDDPLILSVNYLEFPSNQKMSI